MWVAVVTGGRIYVVDVVVYVMVERRARQHHNIDDPIMNSRIYTQSRHHPGVMTHGGLVSPLWALLLAPS